MAQRLTPMLWFVVLLIITVVLALALPPDPQSLAQLHTSAGIYRLAILLLLFPYALIWYTAFYAYGRLQKYTHYLQASKEAMGFRKITRGMGILAFGLIVPTIIALIFGAIAGAHPGFKPAATIVDNYLTLLVAVSAFSYTSSGSRLLVMTTRIRTSIWTMRVSALLFITLGAWYTYLVIHNRYVHNLYHLPTPLLLLTFIIPYLYAWFVALVCAFELRIYARHVRGLLYKHALRQFSTGISVVIAGSVAIQFVTNTFAARVSNSLGALVLLDYALLLIIAAGLVLVAFGTKKLQKIEEV